MSMQSSDIDPHDLPIIGPYSEDRVFTMRVLVTPELAKKWLGWNTRNRTARHPLITKYARDLTEGRFPFTGDGAKFAHTGLLLDGQKRFMAVVETGIPMLMNITCGLLEETQAYMDNNDKRSAADVLQLQGVPNSKNVAAVARSLFLLWNKREPSRTETCELYRENEPLIQKSMHYLHMASAEGIKGGTMHSVAWFLFAQVDEEAANQFMTTLITGLNIGEDDPIRLLRRELTNDKRKGRQAGNVYGIRSTLRPYVLTWNAWCTGRRNVTGLRSTSSDLPALKRPRLFSYC